MIHYNLSVLSNNNAKNNTKAQLNLSDSYFFLKTIFGPRNGLLPSFIWIKLNPSFTSQIQQIQDLHTQLDLDLYQAHYQYNMNVWPI